MTKIIDINGYTIETDNTDTLLTLAAKNGLYLPFSCLDGKCKSCEVEVAPEDTNKFSKVLACKFRVTTSIKCNANRLLDRTLPKELSFPVKISEILKLSASYYKVSLKYPKSVSFDHERGQFIDLVNEIGITRSYSIFQISQRNEISLLVTRLLNGSFSHFLTDKENIGKRLNLRGPKGSSILPLHCMNKKILFIATGSGISPVYNIILNHAFDLKPDVFWGLRDRRDCPSAVVHNIESVARLEMCYSAEGRRVTTSIGFEELMPYDLIYAAGNPKMLEELQNNISARQGPKEVTLVTDPFYNQN